MHRNVPLGIATSLIYAVTRGLAIAIDAFVLLRTNSNLNVGIMEGACGMATLILTCIAGVAADRVRRTRVLRLASLVVAATAVGLALVILEATRLSSSVLFYWMCAVAIVRGVGQGLFSPPYEALFGDSTPHGSRSRWCVCMSPSSGALYHRRETAGALMNIDLQNMCP